MKKIITLIFIALLLLGACKKDKKDYVNDFSPTLKEAANTKYSGNYFPMHKYYHWSWNGDMSITGKISSGGESIPLDQSGDAYGYMNVVDSTIIHLPSGSYHVLQTSETGNMARYFQVSDTAVFIRAIKMDDTSSLVEVKNPVFLRNPLIVGDKWQTQPSIDMSSLVSKLSTFGVSGIKININCLIFVLGKENISLNGSTVPTIALEERVEMTGSIIFNEIYTGTLNMSATADIKLNLEKDTGIVKQVTSMTENASGNLKVGGQGGNISMKMTIDQTATLSDFYKNSYYKNSVESKEISVSDQLKGNKLADNQMKAVSKIFTIIQKLSTP